MLETPLSKKSQRWFTDDRKGTLGYPAKLNCVGFSAVAIIFAFLNKRDEFFDLLKFIRSIPSDTFQKTIEDGKEKLKHAGKILTPELEKIIDTLSVFDLIQLFQEIYLYPHLAEKGKAPKHQNMLQTIQAMPFVLPEALKKQGGITKITEFCGLYTEETFTDCLESLSQTLNTTEIHQPVAFMFHNNRHVVVVIYTSDISPHWELIDINDDINDLPTRNIGTSTEIAKKVINGLSDGLLPEGNRAPPNGIAVIFAEFFCIQSEKERLEPPIKAWEKENKKVIFDAFAQNSQLTDSLGVTLLHLAAGEGFYEEVKGLVAQKADVHAVAWDKRCSVPICEAAYKGHLNIIQHLVAFGADINQTEKDGYTALLAASKYGYFAVVKYLVEQGADINAADGKGNTALLIASERGHYKTVVCLVEHGADISQPNNKGIIPLVVAVMRGHLKIVKYFVEKQKADINKPNKEGHTLVFYAADNGHSRIVVYLAEQGADVNKPGLNGGTPLHAAAHRNHFDTLKCLLQHGANSNAVTKGDLNTPLHVASYSAQLESIQCLLEHDVNRNTVNAVTAPEDKYTTSLFKAVQYDDNSYASNKSRHIESVRLLLAQCARTKSSVSSVSPMEAIDPRDANVLLKCAEMVDKKPEMEALIHAKEIESSNISVMDVALCLGDQSAIDIFLRIQFDIIRKQISDPTVLTEIDRVLSKNDKLTPKHYDEIAYYVDKVAPFINPLFDKNSAFPSDALWFSHCAFLPKGHFWFAEKMQEIGCNITRMSLVTTEVCAGVSFTATLFFLMGQPEIFFTFLRLLASIQDGELKKTITDSKRQLKRARAAGILPSKGSEKIIKISAFIETIDLFQNIPLYTLLYKLEEQSMEVNSISKGQDILKTAPLLLPEELEREGGIKQIYEFSGLYDKHDLDHCFKSLHQAFENAEQRIVIVLSNLLHRVGIGYGPGKKYFWIYDGNDISTQQIIPVGRMAEKVMKILGDKETITFSAEIYTTQSNQEILNACIQGLKKQEIWQAIHAVNAKKAKLTDANSTSWLHIASFNGCFDTVKSLIEQGADIHALRYDGSTPLATAAMHAHFEVIKYLITFGAITDINRANTADSGLTPLHEAVYSGNLEIIKFLVKQGADPRKLDAYGKTPLSIAAKRGYVNVVEYLNEVTQGTDINKSSNDGSTPLCLAALSGSVHVVMFLLDHGAKPDIDKPNNEGLTPLFAAAQNGYLQVVKCLHKAGADINKNRDVHGATLLHVASHYNHLDVAQYLVSNEADVRAVTEGDLNTPLHIASYEGNTDMIRFLIDKGADVCAVTGAPDHFITSLSCAADYDHIEALLLLLEKSPRMRSAPASISGTNPMWVVDTRTPEQLINYAKQFKKQWAMQLWIDAKKTEFGDESAFEVSVMEVALRSGNDRLVTIYNRAHLQTIFYAILACYDKADAKDALIEINNVLNQSKDITPERYDEVAERVESLLTEKLKKLACNQEDSGVYSMSHADTYLQHQNIIAHLNAMKNLGMYRFETFLPEKQDWFSKAKYETGYNRTEKGKNCSGFSVATALSMLSKDGFEKFFARLQLIYYLSKRGRLKQEIDNCKERLKQASEIPASELEDILEKIEISSFFEIINVFQNAEDYQAIFEKGTALKHQDITKTMSLALSKELEEKGGVVQISKFCGLYDEETLIDYLESFGEQLKLAGVIEPVALILCNVRHAIALIKNKNFWILINPDNLSMQNIGNAREIAKGVMHGLSGGYAKDDAVIPSNGTTTFFIEVYGPASNQKTLERCIQRLKEQKIWQMIHAVDDKKAHLIDAKATSWLHVAAYSGDLDTVKLLIKQGANVDAIRYGGYTALFDAVDCNHFEIVTCLVEQGADVNKVSDNDFTPLDYAASVGNLDMLRYLLQRSAHVNKERVPFMAVLYGNLNVVQYYIEEKIEKFNIDEANDFSKTLLFVAAENGFADSVDYLLKKGANCNKPTFNGDTPLSVAAQKGYFNVVKCLAKSGKTEINQLNTEGKTPLFSAVEYGHFDVVKCLIEEGADVNQSDFEGGTPLHRAAFNNNFEIVQYLVEHGACIEAVTRDDHNTPLHTASYGACVEVVNYLIEQKANVHAVTGEIDKYSTPLSCAARYDNVAANKKSRHVETVALLLKKHDRVDSSTSNTQINPMQAADGRSSEELLRYAEQLDKKSEMQALINAKQDIAKISVMETALCVNDAFLIDALYRVHLKNIRNDMSNSYGAIGSNDALTLIDRTLNPEDTLITQLDYEGLINKLDLLLKALNDQILFGSIRITCAFFKPENTNNFTMQQHAETLPCNHC